MDWTQIVVVLITTLGAGCGLVWSALVSVGRFLAPRMDESFKAWNLFLAKLSNQHEVLERFAVSFHVLSQMLTSQQSVINRGRWLILSVEDSEVMRHRVNSAVLSLIKDEASLRCLTFQDVSTLAEAYKLQMFCRIIIMDVGLPDADPEQVKAFVRICRGCPVIIHSGSDQSPDDFPDAFAIVNKNDKLIELKTRIKEAAMVGT